MWALPRLVSCIVMSSWRPSTDTSTCSQAYHDEQLALLQQTLRADSKAIQAQLVTCLRSSFASETSPCWKAFVQHADACIRAGWGLRCLFTYSLTCLVDVHISAFARLLS
jgi:hypothetical protein